MKKNLKKYWTNLDNHVWMVGEIFFFSIWAILYGFWMFTCLPFISVVGLFSFSAAKWLFRKLDFWNYFEDIVVHDNT